MAHPASTQPDGPFDGASGRLVCVTAAPCVDRYVRVRGFRQGRINHPTDVVAQAGGKGLNVARTARALGMDVALVGLLDDESSGDFRHQVAELGVRARWASAHAETRQCLCVYDDDTGGLTELYEPIPPVPEQSWPALRRSLLETLAESTSDDVVTISGRLPEGLPDTALPDMVAAAHESGVRVLLDTDDPAVPEALTLRPHLLKINAGEAGRLTGIPVDDAESAAPAAERLLERGAHAVIITVGADGSLYTDRTGTRWAGGPPAHPAIPVGSGDAFLAGFATGLLHGFDVRRCQVLGAATATATAETLVVGRIRPQRVVELAELVEVRDAPTAPTGWSTP